MNLSELVFKTNTEDLDKVIKKLAEVGAAVQDLAKVQTKATGDQTRADQAAAKTQDAQNKAAISGIKLEEAKAKAASDTSKTVTESSDKAAAFLQRLEDKISFMTKSFSSGQASILSYGKSLGLTTEQLKDVGTQLDLVRKLQGNDPFDKSLGAVKALSNQYTVLKESVRLYNAETGLTKKQAEDLARDKIRLIEAGKAEGKTTEYIKDRIIETQREYVNTARAVNQLIGAEKAHETATKGTASATAFIDKEMRRAANAANEVNLALGKATNNGLFRFEEALKKTGLTLDQQKLKLKEYKDHLEAVEKSQKGGLQGGNKTDYISRAIGPQITDIVVGLSTGQSPLTVMLQQGGQLRDQLAMNKVAAADMAMTMRNAARDMAVSIKSVAVGMGSLVFGIVKDSAIGLGNIAMKVTGLAKAFDVLTQYTLRLDLMTAGATNLTKVVDILAVAFRAAFATGILLAVAALVLIAVELYKVMQASTELSQALNTSGASMGATTSNLTALAKGMGDTGKSTSYLISAFTEVAKAGVFTSKEFEVIVRSAINMEKYVGVALKDTIAAFKELKADPVKTLEEFGKANGLVSIAVLENVRALTLQGKTAEATALAMKEMLAVNSTIAAKVKADMSPLDLAWIQTKEGIARATNELLRFIENGIKFKVSSEWGSFSTLLNGISEAIDSVNKKFIELDKQPLTFESLKKNLNEVWDIAKGIGASIADWINRGMPIGGGANASSTKQPDSALKESQAADRARDVAEATALQAKLTAAAQFFGEKALEALTPVQKAQLAYNQVLEKAIQLTKDLGRENGIVGNISLDGANPMTKNVLETIFKAKRDLAAAKFAEVHNLPNLSDATTARYDQIKAGYEQELSLLQKLEKDKLDLLKTRFDEDKMTTLQYIAEKQDILKADGDKQLAILKKEQDETAAEAGAHVAKILAIRDKLLTANAASNTGKTPAEAASIAENITKDAQKKIDDFIERFKTDIGKITSGTESLGTKLFTDLAQSVTEYAKNIKALRKEVDDYNVSEAKHFAALAAAQKTDSQLLWASPEQAAVIKAQAEETKRFIPVIEKFTEAVRKAKKEYDSLFAGGDGIGGGGEGSMTVPGLNPAAIAAGLAVLDEATTILNKKLADQKYNLDKAGVDAAIAYEEQQRAELAKKIADVLTTALFEGGKSGAKALRNLIIAEFKKPITVFIQASVNALMQGGSGFLSGLFGGGGGDGIGGGGEGSMLGGGGGGSALGTIGSLVSAGSSLLGGSGIAASVGVFQSVLAGTGSVLQGATAALSSFTGGLTSSLGILGPIGLALGAVYLILNSLGVFDNKTGIKIDNSVRDGNGRKDIIDSALGQFDVSGDIDNKTFAPLIKSVNALDSYIAKNLLSAESLAAVKERIQSISSNMTDWFGFDDRASAKTAVEKASKLFLQQRYSVAFDEINKTIAAQIRNFAGTADELLKFLNDTLGVLAVLKQAEPTLKGIFGEVVNIDDLLKIQKEGESLTETFTRIVSVFSVTNDIATLMGKTSTEAFGAVGLASLDARENLVKYAGGVSALQSTLKFYMDNFYTDAERGVFALTSAQNTLNAGFSSLGIAVPKTRDEFRALLSGIDTTTDAGAKLYAALLALAPAMAAVTAVTDTVGIKVALGVAQPSMHSTFGQQVSVKDVQAANKTGETLEDTFIRLTNVFKATNLVLDITGKTSEQAFGAIGLASTAAREDLIKFAGGLDALMSAMDFYYQNFFTEAERSAISFASAQTLVNDTFRTAGLALPRNRAEYRALMSSIDLTTDAGRKLYATLIALAPAIATMFPSEINTKTPLKAPDNTIPILAGMAESSIVSLFKTVISTATDAEDARIKGTKAAGEMFFDSIMNTLLGQISGVIMSAIIEPMSAGLLNATRVANVSTIETAVTTGRITETSAVVAGNNNITGSIMAGSALVVGGSVAASAIAAAVDKIVATIAVLSAVFASPEFQTAYRTFTAAIGTLSGAVFTAATSAPGYARPTGTGDRGTSTSTDTRAEQEKKLRQEAYDLLVASINKEKELIKTQLDLVKAIYETTISAIKTLKAEVETPQGTTYQNARALISKTVLDVKNGVLPDATAYSNAVDSAINGVNTADYATIADEQIAKMQLLNDLQSIADVLGPAKTGLEQQLAYLDQLAATAKLQLDAANGTTVAVLSLTAAMANWAAVMGAGSITGGTGRLLPRTGAAAVSSAASDSFSPTTSFSSFAPVALNSFGAAPSGGSAADSSAVDELRLLRNEISMLRAETRSIVDSSGKTARTLDRVVQSADAIQVTIV